MDLEALFNAVKEAALPGIWSRGVALSRENMVVEASADDEEIKLNVLVRDKPVSPQVSLWPADAEWYCDCKDRNDPCLHVVAAVVAKKNGTLRVQGAEASHAQSPTAGGAKGFTEVIYKFWRREGRLWFERHLRQDGKEQILPESLVGFVGGVQSGRVRALPVAATKDDFAIDSIIADQRKGFLELKVLRQLTKLLKGSGRLYLDDKPATVEELQIPAETERARDQVAVPLRAVLATRREPTGALFVMPQLIYGHPGSEPIAKIEGSRVVPTRNDLEPIRDSAAEKEWVRRLQSELHLAVGQWRLFEGSAAFEVARKLRDWEIVGDGLDAFMGTPRLEGQIVLERDVLELRFGLNGAGAPVDSAKTLDAWMAGDSFVKMSDGRWAELPKDWLALYGDRILELLAAREKSGKLPAYLAPTAADLFDEMGVGYPESLKRLRDSLESFEAIPEVKLPQDLQVKLRDYQRAGVNWLSYLRSLSMGALLADDMGLGKTLQALCSIQGRTLVVAPTSVLYGWAAQIEQFRPGLKFSVFHGPNRKFDQSADVVLTTYSILRIDRDILTAENWSTAVLDESQMIKNPDSQVAQAAFGIRADFRVALTGTPLENRLDDLWSQFQFLNPGLLGPRSEGLRVENVRRKTKPFILRRLKRDVAKELPPRTETVLQAELTDTERTTYDVTLAAARSEALPLLESGGSLLTVLELLLRLRQACCHPSLVPGESAATSAKVELLVETLQASLAAGHRALVFSQWTSFLDLIEARLEKEGVSMLRIDGATPNRQAIVDRFQTDSSVGVMLLSLKAGGVGLTLTAADHVFLMDPWWNPSVEEQAADRAHRIGQTNPVLVHRLIAKDTIEEKILDLQRKKKMLSEAVLEGTAASVSLTREDLLEILR